MTLSFGPFELDEQRFELRRRGRPLALPRRVLETITYLVKNRDRLISKDELLAGPWQGTAVSDAALSRCIMLARRALSDRNERHPLIKTVRGKGYRFLAEVSHSRPAEHAHSKEKPASAVTGALAASSAPTTPRFFGRRGELETMSESLASADAGRGGVIFVGGEPGIGKTTLLQVFAANATNAEVLWGRCWDGEGAPAFWPWLEIIRSYTERHGERAIAMMGPGAPDIALLVPELRAALPKGSSLPSNLDDAQARFRTFDSISRFLVRVAVAESLVLIIDDLHAADDASLLLLQFLSRSVESSKLLVVASYRDLEVANRPVLGALLGGPVGGAVRINLSGLVDDDVGALLASHMAERLPKDVVHRVGRATDGNPFLVGELARALRVHDKGQRFDASAIDAFRIPDRVATIVRRHIERLPPHALKACSVASVIGREFSLTLLAEVLGRDPGEIANALEPALLEGFVREIATAPGTSTFSHALIRETLYQGLPAAERFALHFAIAERLEGRLSTDVANADSSVFQIAHHYFAGVAHRGAEKALEWAVKAAGQSNELFSYELAAQHYERALQVLDLMSGRYEKECELLLRLAQAKALAGDVTEAIATYEKVEGIARKHRNGEYLARGLLGCSDTLRDRAVLHPTLAHRLEESLELVAAGDSVLRARVLAAIPIAGLLQTSMAKRLGSYSAEAVAIARRLGDPEVLAVALHTANWRMMGGDTPPHTAAETATEMIELARRANYNEKLLDGHLWRAYYSLTLGRSADAELDIAEHERVAKRLHHPLHLWWAELAATGLRLRAGDLPEAEALARRAAGRGHPLQGIHAEAIFVAQLLACTLEMVSEARRERMIEIAEKTRKLLEVYPPVVPLLSALAISEIETESVAAGRESFERMVDEDLEKAPRDQNLTPSYTILAGLARQFRDVQRARILYDLLLPRAGRHAIVANVAAHWGPVSHHLGVLARTISAMDLAAAHFEKGAAEAPRRSSPDLEGVGGIRAGSGPARSRPTRR